MSQEDLLIQIVLDQSIDEAARDDAIMYLGDFENDKVLRVLKRIASNVEEELIIQDRSGMVLGDLLLQKKHLNWEYLKLITPQAYDEAYGMIKSEKPEWLEEIINDPAVQNLTLKKMHNKDFKKYQLIQTILDNSNKLNNRLNAINHLCEFDSVKALKVLRKVASTPDEEPDILAACGDTLGEILTRKEKLDWEYLKLVTPKAYNKAYAKIKLKRPEWIEEAINDPLVNSIIKELPPKTEPPEKREFAPSELYTASKVPLKNRKIRVIFDKPRESN